MSKVRPSMPVSLRAKQFMPFKAVGGLDEALEAQRRARLRVPRRELTEESLAELDRAFAAMAPGDEVLVTLYRDGEYITLNAHFGGADPLRREVTLSGQRIPFMDLLSAEKLAEEKK